MIKNYSFRDLTANDVEVRVAMCRENGVSLLIYKDARVDQAILDETVGQMNWKKSYKVIKDNLYCSIEIWDGEKSQWVSKEDCGVESNTEKEKGEASDAQKRAGFVWGIGRELYSAPFIWVSSDKCRIEGNRCKDTFKVSNMTVKDKKITELEIVNEKSGEIVYKMGDKKTLQANTNTQTNQVKTTAKTGSTEKGVISLKESLDTVVSSKSGKTLTMQQTIDNCKTKAAKDKMMDWLKEQANAGKDISDACKMVYMAITKGMIKFPVTA